MPLLQEHNVPVSSDHCAPCDHVFHLCLRGCKPWAAPTSQRASFQEAPCRGELYHATFRKVIFNIKGFRGKGKVQECVLLRYFPHWREKEMYVLMYFFSCCHDNMPNKSNLREEWFILAHSLGEYSPSGQGRQEEQSCCVHSQEGETGQEVGFKTSRPTPSHIHPPARLYFLKVLELSRTAPPVGGQASKHLSQWATFHFQTMAHGKSGLPPWFFCIPKTILKPAC